MLNLIGLLKFVVVPVVASTSVTAYLSHAGVTSSLADLLVYSMVFLYLFGDRIFTVET